MTMREKVARAMRARDRGGDEWDATDQNDRAVWFSLADAALAAMEKPDSEMVEAGAYALVRNATDHGYEPMDDMPFLRKGAAAAFTAAIRHARGRV